MMWSLGPPLCPMSSLLPLRRVLNLQLHLHLLIKAACGSRPKRWAWHLRTRGHRHLQHPTPWCLVPFLLPQHPTPHPVPRPLLHLMNLRLSSNRTLCSTSFLPVSSLPPTRHPQLATCGVPSPSPRERTTLTFQHGPLLHPFRRPLDVLRQRNRRCVPPQLCPHLTDP